MAAVADPNPPAVGRLADDVRSYPDLDALLADGVAPDVVIIATPIQTHCALGLAALAAGADVYLEKPTAASLTQFQELRSAAVTAGRSVQIGFQSLGSLALPALARLIADGGLGTIQGISARGMWVRDKAYYQRSRWAGKRTIDGVDVVDGVTTNPLAHAVATALFIAGIRSADAIESVETDLYRAHDIEGDDTSAVRITPKEGPRVVSALTVCAPEESHPSVRVQGTTGHAVFYYTEDILEITHSEGTTSETFERVDLLENLLAHRHDGTALLSSIENSGAFMRVLEAVRTAEDPRPISEEHLQWVGEGTAAHPVIKDIGAWIDRVTATEATFSELAAPWARRAAAATLTLNGTDVAHHISGATVAEALSPRPYLHPVTTLKAVVVSDAFPLDHPWHLGVGVALQDVNGVNFWGGKTYTRKNECYEWFPDHGRILAVTPEGDPSSDEVQELSWVGPSGEEILREKRTFLATATDDGAWRLTLRFSLTPAGSVPVILGGPGSNGLSGSGYGGFMWRLPATQNTQVRTATGTGEVEVHGRWAPWLAWSGDFAEGPATLVFLAPPEAADPWFVRATEYPAVASALTWDTAVTLAPGESVSRTLNIIVADGIASDEQILSWVKEH